MAEGDGNKDIIAVTRDPIDITTCIMQAREDRSGGLVSFIGTVRDDGIDVMEVEAYEELALEDLGKIRREAKERYHLHTVVIIHRVGKLAIGDIILLIVASAGHREEAFSGCRFIIERIKEQVPIWKKELLAGEGRWVPGESGH